MKQYDIYITTKSSNIIKEFDNYTWKKHRDGRVLDEPIDAFNHAIDAARYAIQEFFKGDQEVDIFI